jgi:hypothetical protein
LQRRESSEGPTGREQVQQHRMRRGQTYSITSSQRSTRVGEADAFDGMWEFTTTGGEFCPLKSFKFRRKFQDGIILSGEGFKIGSINRDGSFQFANPSPANPSITVRSRGTITGDTGEGVFGGIGTPCQGTYQIRLIGRL